MTNPMHLIPTPDTQQLLVMESFYTLQGEGFHQGKAAYFIRLGGCDVGCSWCDVKESWDPSVHPGFSVKEIVQKALKNLSHLSGSSQKNIAIVTGGEPLMQDCTDLTQQLQQAGFCTHLESSGAHPLSGRWDWICLSPKKFKAPLPQIMPLANELKIVVHNRSDFQWAETYASKVSAQCKLFLQPEWERSSQMTPLIIDYIKAHPKWNFSLQLHKYIHVP